MQGELSETRRASIHVGCVRPRRLSPLLSLLERTRCAATRAREVYASQVRGDLDRARLDALTVQVDVRRPLQ